MLDYITINKGNFFLSCTNSFQISLNHIYPFYIVYSKIKYLGNRHDTVVKAFGLHEADLV